VCVHVYARRLVCCHVCVVFREAGGGLVVVDVMWVCVAYVAIDCCVCRGSVKKNVYVLVLAK